MATNWVLNKVSDAIAPTVSNTVASAGGFAGGVVCGVGNSINGVGQSINGAISAYGNGAMDYGNAIKDWTKAPGARSQTAANPLGLTDSITGGKRSVTNPKAPQRANTWGPAVTAPPKGLPPAKSSKAPSRPVNSQKAAAPIKKAPAPVKPNTSAAKPRPTSLGVGKTPNTTLAKSSGPSISGNQGAFKTSNTAAKKVPVASKPKPIVRPKVAGNQAMAKNPLGL